MRPRAKIHPPLNLPSTPSESRFAVAGLGPYALGLTLQQAQLRAALPVQYRAAFAECYTPLQVSALTTEQLLRQVSYRGVSMTPKRFRDLADGHTRAWSVAEEHWLPASWELTPQWESLVGMVAVELWRRLLPGWPCAELLANQVDEGYRLLAAGDRAACREVWSGVWQVIADRADERLDLDAVEVIDSPLDLHEWQIDLSTELGLHAAAQPDAVEPYLTFLRRSIELLDPRERSGEASQIREVGALLLAGRRDEALAALGALAWSAEPKTRRWNDEDGVTMRCWLAETLLFAAAEPPHEDLLLIRELVAEGAKAPHNGDPAEQRILAWVEERLARPAGAEDPAPASKDEQAAAVTRRLRLAYANPSPMPLFKLASLGDAAKPYLLEVLGDAHLAAERWHTTAHAVQLLCQLWPDEAVHHLLRVLRQAFEAGEGALVGACAWDLERLSPSALETLLAAHRTSEEPELREVLRHILSGLGVHDDRVFALLFGELSQDVNQAALNLASYGDERALPPLEALLRRREPDPDDPWLPPRGDDDFTLRMCVDLLGGRGWSRG